MKVSLGFSGEMTVNQWRKGDVEIDEVDLARILADSGLSMDNKDVPRRIAFLIMEAEATQLLYTELQSFGGDPKDCKAAISAAANRQQQALELLKG